MFLGIVDVVDVEVEVVVDVDVDEVIGRMLVVVVDSLAAVAIVVLVEMPLLQ